jgi:hypothetical protein
MKLRRLIFTDLGRTRLGLSEQDVRSIQHPRTGLLVLAGATGLAPVPTKDARDGDTSGRTTGRYPDEQAA